MTIRYKCAACGAAMKIKDELAGTSGKCPSCKAEFTVPSAAPPREAEDRAEEPAAVAAPADAAQAGISEDEIESILEGHGQPAAKRSRKLVIEPDEDPAEPGPRLRRSENPFDQDVDERAGLKKKQAAKSKADRPEEAAAKVARELMAGGEVGLGEEGKRGRPFGAREGAGEAEFTTKEKVLYFGKYALPALLGVVLLIWGVMSLVSVDKIGDLPDLGTVTGLLTLDGVPLDNAVIEFIPLRDANLNVSSKDIQMAGSSSIGYPDKQGRYTLQYKAGVAGAVVGRHVVVVTQREIDAEKGEALIPAPYKTAKSSPLKFEVKKGSNKIDLPLVSENSALETAPQ